MKIVVAIVCLFVVALITVPLLRFGTLSPCGMVRSEARSQAEREGAGPLASMMPDAIIDAFIADRYGNLNPGRCVAIMFGSPPPQPAKPTLHVAEVAQTQNGFPVQAVQKPSYEQLVNAARSKAVAAIIECRNKRLSGELSTRRASAECSNPVLLKSYSDINYPYMDLIRLMAAKRLEEAENIDLGKITEVEANLDYAKFEANLNNMLHRRQAGLQ